MEQRAPTSERFKILIVEDEYLIAMELRELLQEGGYYVVGPIATVAAALAMLNRDRPHACILDVNLRGEHSVPVAYALMEKKVPFVLSSAYENETLEQHAAFDGVINIGKLTPPEKLLSLLASLLRV